MSGKKNGGRLLTEEELALLKARLGLPDHVIEYLRHQPRLSLMANCAGILVLIIFASVLAALPSHIQSSEFGKTLIASGILPPDTLLYKQSVASLVLGMFGGLFLGVYLLYFVTRLLPRIYMKSIVSNIHQATESGLAASLIRWFLKGIDKTVPPQEYLKRYERRQTRIWGRLALVFYGSAALFFVLDIKSLNWVTPETVRLSPYFSSSVLDYEWKDVVGIRTGCVTKEGRSKSHILQYVLTFDDGEAANLGTYRPLGRTRPQALELIDSRLTSIGVPKIMGEFDRSCLDAKRKKLGREDYERLMRLLQPRAAGTAD